MMPRRSLSLLRFAGAACVAAALSACAGTLPGAVSEEPAAPKIDMAGRWLLTAPNSPPCGMMFGAGGTIAPEGGCPGNFFTSRHWTLEQSGLVINDHNNEPLAQLHFVGGHFEGKATSGLSVTLARSVLPTN
jgi:hypothetical protein